MGEVHDVDSHTLYPHGEEEDDADLGERLAEKHRYLKEYSGIWPDRQLHYDLPRVLSIAWPSSLVVHAFSIFISISVCTVRHPTVHQSQGGFFDLQYPSTSRPHDISAAIPWRLSTQETTPPSGVHQRGVWLILHVQRFSDRVYRHGFIHGWIWEIQSEFVARIIDSGLQQSVQLCL